MKYISLMQGKQKKKNNLVSIILNSYNYTVFIGLISLVCFFNSFNLSQGYNFDKSFTIFFTTKLFVLMLMAFLFFNTNKIINWLDHNKSFVIRLNNKKNYLRKLINVTTISNIIVFSMFIIISLTMIILKVGFKIEFTNIDYYNVPYIIYDIVLIIKYYVIINFISCFGIIINKCFGKNTSYIFYLFIMIFYYGFSLPINEISGFQISNLIYVYYLESLPYTTYLNEIANFIIVSNIYYILLELFYYTILKYKKIRI